MTTLVQVMRFLTNPHKPMILALSRPDPKKNITTLVKAFGECRPLRELANLVRNSLFEVQINSVVTSEHIMFVICILSNNYSYNDHDEGTLVFISNRPI